MKGHLGNFQELLQYTLQMQIELDKHKKEKSSLRYLDKQYVNNFVLENIQKRSKNLTLQDLYFHKSLIQKQFVHIGNYAMFGYVNLLNFVGVND